MSQGGHLAVFIGFYRDLVYESLFAKVNFAGDLF